MYRGMREGTFMLQRSTSCPHCGRTIAADRRNCDWCGAKRPGVWARLAAAARIDGEGDLLLKGIIAVNIVFYLLSLLLGEGAGYGASPLAFLSPGRDSLLILGATGTVPVVELGRYWTLISASYLHGGLLHLFFNMMALRQIAPLVNAEFGPSRMFAIYTLSGIAGYLASCLAGVPFTIGASAAVCGLIGALYYFGKSRGGSYGSRVSSEVSGWLVSLVIFGRVVPGINNWGHGGGIVGGVLFGKLLGYREQGRESAGHRLLALLCLLATIVVLAWSAVTALAIRFS